MSRFFGLLGVCLMALLASARAMAMPQDMHEALQRKYDILQQQADTDKMRAETERNRVEAETAQAQAQSNGANGQRSTSSGYVPTTVPQGNALAGTHVPSCTTGGGASIQVSGGFRPAQNEKCVRGN
jgi:hypothetical protein